MPTNINDATYFEIRLVEEICLVKNLNFKYAHELEQRKALVLASHKDKTVSKLQIQEKRLKAGMPAMVKEIENLESLYENKLLSIDWVGTTDRGDRVADIDLHVGRKIVPISVKSGGNGTERNLGGRSLKNILGYDPTPLIDSMMQEVLTAFLKKYPNTNFGKSWGDIRQAILQSIDKNYMRKEANKIGKKYQRELSEQILKALKGANDPEIITFIKYLALQNSPRDLGLRIFVAKDSDAQIKSAPNISDISADKIMFEKDVTSSKGTLKVLIGTKGMWRLNINFTNGIGLSPLALRAFLI